MMIGCVVDRTCVVPSGAICVVVGVSRAGRSRKVGLRCDIQVGGSALAR